jgi:hypothetical protein
MGYTHYWTQTRNFTQDEWSEVSEDISAILSYVENELGVPLADGMGEHRTRPAIDADEIAFNGLGDDSHETFTVTRKRVKTWEGGTLGGDCCKTARKPYDVAVTACLCYLASVTETHGVSSDGYGSDFVDGLNAARQAVPRKANVLDIPMDIMKRDRWTGPWVHNYSDKAGFAARFCIDGYAYVEKLRTDEWYRFDSHEAMARFLEANKRATFRTGGTMRWGTYGKVEPDIWYATGSFDQARHDRIGRAQTKVLARLFPVDAEHAHRPPAFVRPGELPRPEDNGTFCYSLSELIQRCDAIAA